MHRKPLILWDILQANLTNGDATEFRLRHHLESCGFLHLYMSTKNVSFLERFREVYFANLLFSLHRRLYVKQQLSAVVHFLVQNWKSTYFFTLQFQKAPPPQ